MNVLFIQPLITKYERYSSSIGAAGGQQIPLGIYYLTAYIRTQGHTVDAIDAEALEMGHDDLIAVLRRSRYDLIGISSTTMSFHRALETAQCIKTAFPEQRIVIGGPSVSSQPRHALSFDEFDYGIYGEGEETCAELIKAMEQYLPFGDIAGLVYRKNGEVIVNPSRTLIANLDSIPFPAYDKIDNFDYYTPPPCNYKKKPVINVITSRGCPNQCTFCDRNTFGQTLRLRSAENIAKEIEMLIMDYGAKEIAFVDDTFTLKPKRLYEIFSLLDRKGLKFPWTCMARINTVDYELLKFMKEKGCWHISFGIESGNEDILKKIKKNIALDKVETIIGYCKELKILTKGFFIVGHPGESVETINETIEYALTLKLDDIVATINTPIPGTEQYQNISEYGQLDESNWSKFNYWNPVFVPYGLTRQLLQEKHSEFYRRFYFRPRIMWRYFRSLFTLTGPGRLWMLMKSAGFLLNQNNRH
jgi:radical SAM superfamily enzyme YgiQ (UPF0313 family)